MLSGVTPLFFIGCHCLAISGNFSANELVTDTLYTAHDAQPLPETRAAYVKDWGVLQLPLELSFSAKRYCGWRMSLNYLEIQSSSLYPPDQA